MRNNNVVLPLININEIPKVKIFINVFCINIWIMLLIWILNNKFLNIMITLLKGLSEGITFIWVIKIIENLKFLNFISYLLYCIMVIPLFIWITYKVIFSKSRNKEFKVIVICFIIIIIYSLLIAIIN